MLLSPWRYILGIKAWMAGFLKQGTSPAKLALAITLGLAFGIIPVLGISTAICAALAYLLRVNPLVIQAANYVVYPFQIILIVPFIRLGQRITGIHLLPYKVSDIVELFRTDWLAAFGDFWLAGLIGLISWGCVLALPCCLLYYLLKRFLRGMQQDRAAV